MPEMVQTTLTVVTDPTNEPVSLSLARQHCRIDHNSDDTLLAIYITVARQMAERYLARALLTQTLLWTARPYMARRTEISYLNGPLFLPRAPVQSVGAVTILDRLGNSTAIVAATLPVVPPAALIGYELDTQTEPAKLYIGPATPLNGSPSQGILTLRSVQLESVAVEFDAGYEDVDAIPKAIVNAILLTVAFLYENRGDAGGEMPRAAEWLLDPYRIQFVG
jgi:uncharacterized phiE125 gp8 family phage protein